MNETSFEGLLTDYALGEIDDPETKALLEALLERDDSLQESLAEIRTTTELIVLAGAESLVGDSQPKRPARIHRPARFAIAVGMAAALALASLIWWWPTSLSNTQSDSNMAKGDGQELPSTLTEKKHESPTDVDAAGGHPLPWLTAAVEKRSTRSSRRGAGIRWPSLASSQSAGRH